MKVFRYEHEVDGLGPFQCAKYKYDWLFNPFKNHRSPYDFKEYEDFVKDKPNWMGLARSNYIFGMQSLESLFDLLRFSKEEMTTYGFVVAVYDVKEDFVCFPDGQVMFNKNLVQKCSI